MPNAAHISFCSLVREIATIGPTTPQTRRAHRSRVSSKQERTALNVFKKWVDDLHHRFSPLPSGTTAICFRFLFPEEDWRRRYDIQERMMAKLLQDCYIIQEESFDKWSLEESSGCLGQELRVVLNQRTSVSRPLVTYVSCMLLIRTTTLSRFLLG